MKHQFEIEPSFGLAMRNNHPNVKGEVHIGLNSAEITLFAPDGKTGRASVYVEYYDGEVRAIICNEKDQNKDATISLVLIPDPRQPPPD